MQKIKKQKQNKAKQNILYKVKQNVLYKKAWKTEFAQHDYDDNDDESRAR